VDGGIKSDSAVLAAQAGADVLVAGSAIFNKKYSVQEGMHRLATALTQAGFSPVVQAAL
jgi:ribulose-phosphate 3-epimerase